MCSCSIVNSTTLNVPWDAFVNVAADDDVIVAVVVAVDEVAARASNI